MQLKYQFPDSFFEEEKATFCIDKDRKRLWAALLDLLAEFDRVCRKHNIKYSIDGGTMLGKARHNGIIPWDDDIDIIIQRSEYDKLLKVATEEFTEPYFLQTMQSDPEAIRGHPLLRNSSMTAILKDEFKDGKALNKAYNQGLFMDIFVLDSVPDDNDERRMYFAELSRLKDLIIVARSLRHPNVSCKLSVHNVANILRVVRSWLSVYRERRAAGNEDLLVYLQSKFDSACRRYENVRTREVSHLLFEPDPVPSRIFERAKVEEVMDVDFMGIKTSMLKEWEYYLSHLYGNWCKYVVGATQHGGLYIDLEHSYLDYFK